MSRASSPGIPERTGSVPTTSGPAPFATRSASPGGRYPDRTVDEMTEFERPPVLGPRDSTSLPVTRAERRAAGAMNVRNDWHLCWDENDPVPTPWRGYDLSYFAQQGDVEDPNETAAVPSETVMESIELESDPLVALRSMARDNQAVIRRQLNGLVELEGTVRRQAVTIERLRRERNGLLEEVDEVTRREDALQSRQNELEFQRERYEGERNQYYNDSIHYRDENRVLQAEVRDLTAQLTAAQALLANQRPVAQPPVSAAPIVQPPVVQPPVNAAPVVQPPVVQPPVAVDPAGAVRGGSRGRVSGGARGTVRGGARGGARGGLRGRAGRGGRGGGAPARRDQPGRSCKVVKNYRQ